MEESNLGVVAGDLDLTPEVGVVAGEDLVDLGVAAGEDFVVFGVVEGDFVLDDLGVVGYLAGMISSEAVTLDSSVCTGVF